MPRPSSESNPLLAAFAPWLAAFPATDAPPGFAAPVLPLWSASLEAQTRLWEQMLEAQRNFWSVYASFFQGFPLPLGIGTKTVAEDEAGLEPAETADGIPDALELQMRTWNHLLDANRSMWTAFSWPAAQDSANAASVGSDPAEVVPIGAAPRRNARAKR